MKVETIAEQLLFATLRIQAVRPGQPDSVGTGFIVTHKWSDDKQGPFLITNRHVIDGTMQGQLNFTLGSQNGDGLAPLIGKSTSITLGQDAWGWIYHPRNDIDIAALPVAPVVKHLANKNELPYYKSIPTDLIPTQEKLEDLDAVEEVLFVGYPSGIYDSVNNLPITRKGISATPLSIDYEGKPVFLVDASVFPGSSGSPVFIYNNGYWATRKGRLMSGNRVFFLGNL